MSPRSIRRAAERRQQKLLKQQNRALAMPAGPDEAALLSEPKIQTNDPARQAQTSEARLAANRANAQLSTGPTSPEGKAKSSLNAVKTGLTGRTVLLPADDAAAYQNYVATFFPEWQPATDAESALVQSLADTSWRLLRIPSLEAGIYALGRIEFANLFDEHDSALRPALIEAHTYLAYQRQLNNLSIQESRLRRHLEKDTSALQQLQSERRAREVARPRTVQTAAQTIYPDALGFEFSNHQIDVAGAQPASAPQASPPGSHQIAA